MDVISARFLCRYVRWILHKTVQPARAGWKVSIPDRNRDHRQQSPLVIVTLTSLIFCQILPIPAFVHLLNYQYPPHLPTRSCVKSLQSNTPSPPSVCTGRNYIVTGSNISLGLETARHLVRASACTVILACRNIATGETAKTDIERTTGCRNVVQVSHLELSSFASVKAFAVKASNELDRIDGLIEIAGVQLDTSTEA
jgi:hypothetical protein